MAILHLAPNRARFGASLCLAAVFAVTSATVVQGENVTFAFSGTVSEVVATYHPLYDGELYELTIEPAFAEAFFSGQRVEGQYTFDSEEPSFIREGRIQVGDAAYRINGGGVQIDLNHGSVPRIDELVYSSYTTQTITAPIAARAVEFHLNFLFADGLTLETDQLPLVPPQAWSNDSPGFLFFDAGVLWPYQGLRFSIDSITRVPEPSTCCMLAIVGCVYCGAAGCRRTRFRRATRRFEEGEE
jgi:hypothetical protein